MNKYKMFLNKRAFIMTFILSVLGILQGFAQVPVKADKEIKNLIEEGVSAYNSADYQKAEKKFRKALGKDPLNAVASYNLGLTLTEENKNIEAARFFDKAGKLSENEKVKDKSFFNEGNVWLQKKKYEKAIESYKKALRNNPEDEEARYNLAIAMDKLKKQQKKNKKNKKNNKKNKNKNKKKDKKNKKDNKQDKKNQKQQKKEDQKKKDQEKKGDNKKDKQKNKQDKKNKGEKKDERNKQKKDQNKEGGKQKQQPKPGDKPQKPGNKGGNKSKLSPQQVKQLLVGLKNKEKKTQKKIQARILKGKGTKKKTDKDW